MTVAMTVVERVVRMVSRYMVGFDLGNWWEGSGLRVLKRIDVELWFRIVEAEAPPAVLQLSSLPYIVWVGGMVRDRGGDSRLHLGRMYEPGRIPEWERRTDLGRTTA